MFKQIQQFMLEFFKKNKNKNKMKSSFKMFKKAKLYYIFVVRNITLYNLFLMLFCA